MNRGYAEGALQSESLQFYLKEIGRFPVLSPADEKEITLRVREGDEEAFRIVVESNLKFVVSMAKKYARSGYPIHELINEGNLGLIEAVRRFDPGRDVRFLTYASWWIRQSILAAIAHYGQTFSIPPKLKHEVYRFEKKVAHLTNELGYSPNFVEISEKLGMTEADVLLMMETIPTQISLNAQVGKHGGVELQEMIEDTMIAPVDTVLIAESFGDQIQKLLNRLDEKERFIVERRFGLCDRERQTLEQVGSELNLSRERVRQLEQQALKKLRRTHSVEQLMSYLN